MVGTLHFAVCADTGHGWRHHMGLKLIDFREIAAYFHNQARRKLDWPSVTFCFVHWRFDLNFANLMQACFCRWHVFLNQKHPDPSSAMRSLDPSDPIGRFKNAATHTSAGKCRNWVIARAGWDRFILLG